MSNKNFLGYYIIGADSYDDAVAGAGLILWSQKKPSYFIKMMNKLLLNIYWIDKELHEEYVKTLSSINVNDVIEEKFKTEMPKRKAYKKRTTNESTASKKNTSSK